MEFEKDEDNLVKMFKCFECGDYFEECELDTADRSHMEEYHGHRIMIDDYYDCCPRCGGNVHEIWVSASELSDR